MRLPVLDWLWRLLCASWQNVHASPRTHAPTRRFSERHGEQVPLEWPREPTDHLRPALLLALPVESQDIAGGGGIVAVTGREYDAGADALRDRTWRSLGSLV